MKDIITLLRIAKLQKETLGVLYYNRKPFAVTLELPWQDNEVGKSCIPERWYTAELYQSKKFGECYSLEVAGRTGILFHVGNTYRDTTGCILVGESFKLNEEGGVSIARSKIAMDTMLELLNKQSFNLHVTSYADF